MYEFFVNFLLTLKTIGWFVIPYLIWVVYTAYYRKKWKIAAIQILIPVLLIAGVMGHGYVVFKNFQKSIYGSSVDFKDPIYTYFSGVSSIYNYHTVKVYELPESLRKRFQVVDQELLGGYPKLEGERKDWRVETWREAPIDSQFNEYLSLALNKGGPKSDPSLLPYYEEIRNCLSREGTYYAFRYDDADVLNIEMYVIDLKNERVYTISNIIF